MCRSVIRPRRQLFNFFILFFFVRLYQKTTSLCVGHINNITFVNSENILNSQLHISKILEKEFGAL